MGKKHSGSPEGRRGWPAMLLMDWAEPWAKKREFAKRTEGGIATKTRKGEGKPV